MKIIIVRHAETDINVKRIMPGKYGGRLSENGKKQAERLAERLQKEKIHAIITSDTGDAFTQQR